jgi:hypothetical protein
MSSTPFFLNEGQYAPFGLGWLRGLTPERFALVLTVCLILALPRVWAPLLQGDYPKAAWIQLDRTFRPLFCALPMLILVLGAERATARSTARRRIIALALAVLAGAVAYSAIRTGLRMAMGVGPGLSYLLQASMAYFVHSCAIGGALTAILYLTGREREAARRLHQARLERVDVDRQLAEANLQLLRAQIEPHFLFNSLASVKRLYEGDRRKGRALLVDMAAYLRAATANAAHRGVRLGEEVALARSFLGICQLRMGKRLTVRIEVPRDHESALVPPMAIGTLVENAIKHGLGPRGAGGTLTLTASRDGDALVVGVGDDGVGFHARSGTGVGLSNTRARLATLFGASARLDLVANPAGGVTATLRIPYRMAA